MKKSLFISLLTIPTILYAQVPLPYIEAQPPAEKTWEYFCKKVLEKGQPQKVFPPQELDVRTCDISSWDFTNYTADELADVLSFDSKTILPPATKLPKNFHPKKILENGKKPGLHIKRLHEKGIDGRGVSVAIIDQNLLTDHQEYKNNLTWYQEDEFWKKEEYSASMHGAAVASILAGKTVGVAPKASLFFLAEDFRNEGEFFDSTPIAIALEHIAYINSQLPKEMKIRVVSISRGFDFTDIGSDKLLEAKNKLEEQGVVVFATNDVQTLSRLHSSDNPDKVSSYCRPPYWWQKEEYADLASNRALIVPTDFRTTAAPNGIGDYVHYANGGLSWAVPYVAGLYALGVQVYPNLTKEIFKDAWAKTASKQVCEFNNTPFKVEMLANPEKLINYLKRLNTND